MPPTGWKPEALRVQSPPARTSIGLTQNTSVTLTSSPSPDAKGERVLRLFSFKDAKRERGSFFRDLCVSPVQV
jgi:hypothetical protein